MNFTTKISIQKHNHSITYDSKIMLLGSCFAESMGKKFDYFKFQNTTNPFGIIFNPISLAKIIERSAQKEYFTEDDIFFHNDLWQCYEVHSELSHPDKAIFLHSLNELINSTHTQLNDLTHLIITLGTSWVYRNIETNAIVANCHKVPQKQFTKELLSINQIEESLKSIISLIQEVNPNCNFIFTVSPVRHIKNGFVENTLSKSHLITALHKTITHHPLSITYFPSYEIMMDELRDYRFYAEDMLHPSQTAIDYIWEQFSDFAFSADTKILLKEVEGIQKRMAHKSFQPQSEGHKLFKQKLASDCQSLQAKFPFMQFEL
ncbi:GSCFA domain-containing protein [Flavobacterium sp. 20NA77.7]|uniref:GSCFA domain-containing protein n=1 Tax=Flavobacterium nakdongensis TaxID=3073563 RepID=A0ABY9RAN5_9FLAO|nr:GSCFA domain-containing protein [Flavobacterium sp. 20NA77.7]WMW78293.1 GSCFA domain-containing protein [Flavobacterium sp. 20NA77.7]